MSKQEEETQIVALYREGLTLAEVSARTGRGYKMIRRVLQDHEVEVSPHWKRERPNATKRHLFIEQVVRMHNEGSSSADIARAIRVHEGTVAIWLKEEGLNPRVKPSAPSFSGDTARQEKRTQALALFQEGMSIAKVAERLEVPQGTVNSWVHRANLSGKGGRWQKRDEDRKTIMGFHDQGQSVTEIMKSTGFSFYKVRAALAEGGVETDPVGTCANEGCDNPVYSPERKYCSVDCMHQGQPRRQKDPENYIDLVCENPACGKTFSRYRKLYTPGQRVFCSNECSAKVLKAIHHVVDLETSTVLDSGWEALFWGLCRFLKVPIERTDRTLAVEWAPGQWYAPDFLMGTTWVEVKGLEDDDDPTKWDSWRVLRGQLAVLDRDQLDALRRCESYMVMDYLRLAAAPWKIMGAGDSDISGDRI